MKNINIRKWYYHFRHRYVTMNNVVIAVALIIGASWTWGSIGMMQRNYNLQKEVDGKKRDQQLADLEVQTLAYQQHYYQCIRTFSQENSSTTIHKTFPIGMYHSIIPM